MSAGRARRRQVGALRGEFVDFHAHQLGIEDGWGGIASRVRAAAHGMASR